MSAPALTPRPLRTSGASAPARPLLRVVKSPRRSRSRGPLVVTCMTILGSALLGTLLLNTAMAADAYQLRTLHTQVAQLATTEQDLTDKLQAIASPAQLAQAANGLGMVEVTKPKYIRLADSTIVGG